MIEGGPFLSFYSLLRNLTREFSTISDVRVNLIEEFNPFQDYSYFTTSRHKLNCEPSKLYFQTLAAFEKRCQETKDTGDRYYDITKNLNLLA